MTISKHGASRECNPGPAPDKVFCEAGEGEEVSSSSGDPVAGHSAVFECAALLHKQRISEEAAWRIRVTSDEHEACAVACPLLRNAEIEACPFPACCRDAQVAQLFSAELGTAREQERGLCSQNTQSFPPCVRVRQECIDPANAMSHFSSLHWCV